MNRFENFENIAIPDNRHAFLNLFKGYEILLGATCHHIFTLPFKYYNEIKNIEILYSQGLNTILDILVTNDMIVEITDNKTVIKIVLSPEQTKLFEYTPLDTCCQIKITMVNEDIFYGKKEKIKIISTINTLEE